MRTFGSSPAVGRGGPGNLDVIREPQGGMAFAAEHTEAHSGYMESAVRSGARVTRDIRADWDRAESDRDLR